MILSIRSPHPRFVHFCKHCLYWRETVGSSIRKSFYVFLCKTRGISQKRCLMFSSQPIQSCIENPSVFSGKGHERSLLSDEVAHRIGHRQKKKVSASGEASRPSGWETGDIAEARSVPNESFVDPAHFWVTGDGSVERYKPPIVREKIKTQNTSIATNPEACLSSATSTPSHVVEEAPSPTPRSLHQLKESDLTTRDILWRKMKGSVRWSNVVQFLARLGCSIISLDGSKKKVVDEHTGRCTVLHRPHPNEECRRNQLDSYRMHLEDWLLINYEDLVTPEERNSSSRSAGMNLDSSKDVNEDWL